MFYQTIINLSLLEVDDISGYLSFLRDETTAYHNHLRDIFNILIATVGTIATIVLSLLTWLGIKSYKSIESLVRKHIDNTIDQRIELETNAQINRISFKLKSARNKLESLEKELANTNKMIMELSYRATVFGEKLGDNDIAEIKTKNQRNKRILWVDDNMGNNKYIISILQQNGYIICESASSDDALKQLMSTKYGMIISDIDRDFFADEGIRFLRKVNEQYSGIPVVIFSSLESIAKYGSKAIAAGAVYVTDDTSQLLGYIQRQTEL